MTPRHARRRSSGPWAAATRRRFFNWGMQLGARVTFDNKVFMEMDAGFSRFYFTYGEQLQTIAVGEGEDPSRGRRCCPASGSG